MDSLVRIDNKRTKCVVIVICVLLVLNVIVGVTVLTLLKMEHYEYEPSARRIDLKDLISEVRI